MTFSQHIVAYVGDEEALLGLAGEAKDDPPPGVTAMRVLRFRDKPGRYVIQVDFETWEAADANNDREETKEWAARLADLIEGEPKYENLDVVADIYP